MESFTTAIQGLMKTDNDFSQQIKERLVQQSNNVKNPYRFLAGLFTEGVLSDESKDPDAVHGLKGIIVQLAISIASSKGADAVGGLIQALDASGNSEIVEALHIWAKQDFGIGNEGKPSKSIESASAVPTPATIKLPKNATSPIESTANGTKLIDKIMARARVEDDFMEQLQGHLVGQASEIVNTTEFCTSLVHENVLEMTGIQLATGTDALERRWTERAIRAACSKKAIRSLVGALQSSKNERILVQTYDWLESSPVRKNNPIAVKSLANQPKPTATGLFAATNKGLISLDLQTFKAKSLTRELTYAVAVNHKMRKVYWSQDLGERDSIIMRSNFDGSAKEIVVAPAGDMVSMLAIDAASGNVYFALYYTSEIKVCNAFGKSCATVISNSSLVLNPVGIALDSDSGVMYCGIIGSWPSSLVRANLDGSNVTLIYTGFNSPEAITLERPSNKVLYWADWADNAIGTIDVNDGNKRTLLELEGSPGPWGIQVDTHKIYFSNLNSKNIQTVDKRSGKGLTTIFNSTEKVRHLALFYAPA